MVHNTGFFELAEALPSEDIGADQFQYAVTVIDGDREPVALTSPNEKRPSGHARPEGPNKVAYQWI